MTIAVWDWDKGMGDDFLGEVSLSARRIRRMRDQQVWVSLEKAKKGKVRIF